MLVQRTHDALGAAEYLLQQEYVGHARPAREHPVREPAHVVAVPHVAGASDPAAFTQVRGHHHDSRFSPGALAERCSAAAVGDAIGAISNTAAPIADTVASTHVRRIAMPADDPGLTWRAREAAMKRPLSSAWVLTPRCGTLYRPAR
jgi:hypothetical protein